VVEELAVLLHDGRDFIEPGEVTISDCRDVRWALESEDLPKIKVSCVSTECIRRGESGNARSGGKEVEPVSAGAVEGADLGVGAVRVRASVGGVHQEGRVASGGAGSGSSDTKDVRIPAVRVIVWRGKRSLVEGADELVHDEDDVREDQVCSVSETKIVCLCDAEGGLIRDAGGDVAIVVGWSIGGGDSLEEGYEGAGDQEVRGVVALNDALKEFKLDRVDGTSEFLGAEDLYVEEDGDVELRDIRNPVGRDLVKLGC